VEKGLSSILEIVSAATRQVPDSAWERLPTDLAKMPIIIFMEPRRMNEAIFADTSYWMALVNPRDQIHQKALSVSRQLSSESLLTTEMVLVEVLNSFSDSLYREAVAEWLQASVKMRT